MLVTVANILIQKFFQSFNKFLKTKMWFMRDKPGELELEWHWVVLADECDIGTLDGRCRSDADEPSACKKEDVLIIS